MNKPPQRTCVACREKKSRSDLVRVVRKPDGSVLMDGTSKEPGRGAYICKDDQCLEKARKHGTLSRSLKVELDKDMYEELGRAVSKGI